MRFSIRKKTIAMILSFAIVLIFVSVFIYSNVILNVTEEYYQNKANEQAALIAANVDVELFVGVKNDVAEVFDSSKNRVRSDYWGTPEFDAYVAEFDQVTRTEGFEKLHDFLARMEKATTVKCAYLSYVDVPSESFVYVVDADPEEPCPPGCFDQIYEVNRDLLTDPSRGFPAYITDTEEYGWLVTAGSAIKDASGNVVGYAMVDVSMDEVRSDQIVHIFRLVGPLFAALVLICVLGILIVNRLLVDPIRKLSDVAEDYCKKNSEGKFEGFSKLKIHSGDEIESLAEAMKRMEYDLNERINDILAAKGEAKRSRTIAAEMTEIANKDALTGVRNKTAYDGEAEAIDNAIDAGIARFALVMIDLNGLKKTNDTYGHEQGDELIKGLSDIICGTFSHSPVFRVGGDEFVVIARDAQYDMLDSLVSEFNEKIAKVSSDSSLEPWQRVSAAIGAAKFDPAVDKKVSSVFRRADEAMYKRKREMKEKK